MSEEEKLEIAKQYVDKQLETMKQHGSEPKDMSDQEYKGLIREVAENFNT
ncbi:MAG: hypothetical protein ABSF97_12425 [Candidatus Sulfotelmatobacter sp.]|jgi:hypothetical protein